MKDKSHKTVNQYAKDLYNLLIGYNKNEKINLEKLIDIFNNEFTRIWQTKIDPEIEIKFEIDQEKEEVYMFNENALVLSDEDYKTEEKTNNDDSWKVYSISLDEAKKIKKDAEPGDSVRKEINLAELINPNNVMESKTNKSVVLRESFKAIKSSILQAIKVYLKNQVFEKYSSKIGESIKVSFLTRNNDGSWNVQVEGEAISAFLPASFISTKRKINPGSVREVIIESVDKDAKLSPIRVSLDSPKIVQKIFEKSIPEINEGLIKIVKIERIPGERTKVLVEAVDNVLTNVQGAIMGQDSSRINTIISELNQDNTENDEKLDIIINSNDKVTLIKNSMQPALVVDVVEKPNKANCYYVIVLKENLSVAIGKKGSNSNLASKIAEANLDIISTEEAEELKLDYDKSRIEEIRQLINSNKKYFNTNRRTSRPAFKPRVNKFTKVFNDIPTNLASFDEDVRNYQEQEQDLFSSTEIDNLDFDELLKKHSADFEEDIQDEQNNVDSIFDNLEQKEEKINIKDYQKAKESLKNFKVDSELSAFGLDEDIDFGEFDDDDWQ